MKVSSSPPAGLVPVIGLALVSPALAAVPPTTVEAGVVMTLEAGNEHPQEMPAVPLAPGGDCAQPAAEQQADTAVTSEGNPDGGGVPASPPVADEVPMVDGNPIGYRLASVPGDSPLLYFFITLGAAVIRKTRFPSSFRWRK